MKILIKTLLLIAWFAYLTITMLLMTITSLSWVGFTMWFAGYAFCTTVVIVSLVKEAQQYNTDPSRVAMDIVGCIMLFVIFWPIPAIEMVTGGASYQGPGV